MSALTAAGARAVRGPVRAQPRALQSSRALSVLSRCDHHARRAREPRRHDPLMAPRLFGTDGVRGHAGQWPLDPATVRRLGAAIVRVLDPSAGAARLLIGRDTRESGAWIERELAYGARLAGATVDRRGRPADAGRGLPHAHQRHHAGRRHLGLAQPLRGQRHQGLLRRRPEVHRGARTPRRAGDRRHAAGRSRRRRARARGHGPHGPLPRSPARGAVRRRRLARARGSSSTAPTARPPAWRRRCSPTSASTSI